MQAKDIMTTTVITVSPREKVSAIATLMYQNHISAVPVVDDQNRLLGIVSEGDLLHRQELGTEGRRSWWLTLLTTADQRARDYVKSHAQVAEDIMTHKLVTVSEDTELNKIADLLERHRIKRVPVVRAGQLVGLVSRANIIQALAVRGAAVPEHQAGADDRVIREQLLHTIRKELGMAGTTVNIIVENGVVHLWGVVDSAEQSKAIAVAAQNTAGVREVENRLILFSKLPGAGI